MRRIIIILTAGICVLNTGCAMLFTASIEHREYVQKTRAWHWQADNVQKAYLSTNRELFVCFTGRACSSEDAKPYTVKLLSVPGLDGKKISFKPEQVVRGWPKPGDVSPPRWTPIPVVASRRAISEDRLRAADIPGSVPGSVPGILYYQLPAQKEYVLPGRLTFVYAERVSSDDRFQYVTLYCLPGKRRRHPLAAVFYPLTAPLVLAFDVVTFPIKCVVAPFLFVYYLDEMFW